MLKFNEFLINEADGVQTKIEKLKLKLSENFDAIKEAKKIKKPGDPSSEITSLTKQADLYSDVSSVMKSLIAALKEKEADKAAKPEKPTLY
jgi:hypothetical protein